MSTFSIYMNFTIKNTSVDFYWNELRLWKISKFYFQGRDDSHIYASNRHYNVNTNHHWSLLLSDGENSNSLSQFNLSHNASKVHCRHASSSKGELWSVISTFSSKILLPKIHQSTSVDMNSSWEKFQFFAMLNLSRNEEQKCSILRF